ncbi:MAG: hypothetical protein H7Y06_09465 [Opitutaceae bacterium]|nr:hypothetical protein [Opitutaceae bacterium]
MPSSDWSNSEKKIARRVFDSALQCELAEVMAAFKKKAEAAATPEDMWEVADFLLRAQRNIDAEYDFRYSQLILVFGRLLRQKRIAEEDLAGLAEDKIGGIKTIASL